MQQMIKGVIPSLPTPFTPDLEVDHGSLARVVDYAIAAGAHGLIVMELQGEHFSLGDGERKQAVETILKAANKRVPVIVGVSAATQEQSLIFAQHAEQNGADALIATPPFFRGQSPQRINTFYQALHANTSLPIVVQSSPVGMGSGISTTQQLELVKNNKNIQYLLNENFSNMLTITSLMDEMKKLPENSDVPIAIGSGSSATMMPYEYSRGARFFVPSVELTELCVDLWDALESGDEKAILNKYKILAAPLMFGINYVRSFTKGMLKRRGIIDHITVREASKPAFDDIQEKELDYWKERLQPLFRV